MGTYSIRIIEDDGSAYIVLDFSKVDHEKYPRGFLASEKNIVLEDSVEIPFPDFWIPIRDDSISSNKKLEELDACFSNLYVNVRKICLRWVENKSSSAAYPAIRNAVGELSEIIYRKNHS